MTEENSDKPMFVNSDDGSVTIVVIDNGLPPSQEKEDLAKIMTEENKQSINQEMLENNKVSPEEIESILDEICTEYKDALHELASK